jgi:hypothetical protein
VYCTPLLLPPEFVTTTGPVWTPAGADVLMEVSLQELIAAGRPLNVSVPPLCVAPKLEPKIVTPMPARPALGDMELITGAGGIITLKFTPLLARSWWSVTTTFPDVAPEGTSAVMLESLQLCTVALTPLNATPPNPCVCPKVVPERVIREPTVPDAGPTAVIFGITQNVGPFVENPLTVTTTYPVVQPRGTGTVRLVLLQAVGDATTSLNVMVLEP